MESLEMKGKTVEEAIQRALEQLGVRREEVEITVVKEGRGGILGLGAEEAVVRVTPHEPAPPEADEQSSGDVTEVVKDVLEKLISLMGVSGSVSLQSQPVVDQKIDTSASVVLDIKGDDLGILIGRRGQTLSCLQYLVRLMVGHQTKTWVPIVIDVEGYKQRRYKALQTFALNIAEQVKVRKAPFTMEPMPAYERRIVHLTLSNHPNVTTESIGEGDARKVIVLPRKQEPQAESS
ncbi:MAG: RNA-binding cell elongation regulator Jag/EloR [Chloroflexota bacterium]